MFDRASMGPAVGQTHVAQQMIWQDPDPWAHQARVACQECMKPMEPTAADMKDISHGPPLIQRPGGRDRAGIQ